MVYGINKICIVGLGYVGIPLAIEFDKEFDVIGFDIDDIKINSYINGVDITNEVGDDCLKNSNVIFTSDESKIKDANFYIVAVPTPINEDKTPNLVPIISATEIIAKYINKGDIVVYESTVYPGLTEEICVPIIEEISKLKYKSDFKVGYSPERINPGDKSNKLTSIVKIVSGCDDESLKTISQTYKKIVKAGVYEASSIKVAEAAKILENTQRDINIAFINEASKIFKAIDVDTKSVLDAARSKWNFIDFKPGLVGGNCIGVDPYYLIYRANQFDIYPRVMTSAREVNDSISKHITENIIKQMILNDIKIKGSKVGIFGFTFKENCPDFSNTKVLDIIEQLKSYGMNVVIYDPMADYKYVSRIHGLNLNQIEDMKNLDAVVLAVAHDYFKESYDLSSIEKLYKSDKKVLVDIKRMFMKEEAEDKGYVYWGM